ncbi:hypothetical protein V6Z12_A11G052800 [Gossypium hirsutum]
MIDRYKHQQLQIGSVSPQQISAWAKKILPNGETVGEEGPKFCEQCGVEFVDSQIQRYQMGYIKLACPVTHVWYLKRLPSYIANLLDKPLKELEGLVYCDV